MAGSFAMGPFLVRAALTGFALWVVTKFVHGLSFVGGDTTLQRVGIIFVVVNALMLWITARITENTTHWGLQIDHFWWTAVWAAIVLSLVSWVLSLATRDLRRT